MEIPQLIVDLAIMLSTAAAVTIIFKKLRIPSILGYIVAGFLIGPNFPLFLDVSSESSIEAWSEIGVVIILFHIGLEFDFHKLSEIGSTAVVSAAVKMGGVMFAGFGLGLLLGMSDMDSVFLGAMLSISSTVVIQKCFSELGLEKERYAGLVMGSLVMEDVFAVFIMVVLTAVSAGKEGGGVSPLQMALMITYLIVWLVLGIYLVPTVLDRAMELMNDETLTLLSLGFCFLMGIIAKLLGFSMELGAFIAGSLFAGTRHVHEVERVTSGIKDMFGAVFFLSVGMMVDPAIIASRWTAIVPIAIIAVVAKLLFATIGMILSGQDFDTAIRGGISLAPIGEFSFIIASLGISLGVMDEYLYPVIVAASILTIIATPVLIKKSDGIVSFFRRITPPWLGRLIMNYTSSERSEEERASEWKEVIQDYAVKIAVYGSIMTAVIMTGCSVIYPKLAGLAGEQVSKWLVLAADILVIAVFARPFMGHRNAAFTQLWMDRLANRPPLVVMILSKIVILEVIAIIPIRVLFGYFNPGLLLVIPFTLFLVTRSGFISTYYLQLEARFFANLNQKTMDERGGERSTQHWLNEDYSIFSWFIPEGAPYAGKTIEHLAWGRNESVYIVKVRRGEKRWPMPSAKTILQSGDKLHVIGDRRSLEAFIKAHDIDEEKINIRTLKDFLASTYDKGHALACAAIKVRGTENYVNRPIRKSGINMGMHCMILGIERDGYATMMPDANMLIAEGDILWIIGTDQNVGRITAKSSAKPGTHSEVSAAAYTSDIKA